LPEQLTAMLLVAGSLLDYVGKRVGRVTECAGHAARRDHLAMQAVAESELFLAAALAYAADAAAVEDHAYRS
jgi:hypothetical protein